MKGYSTREVAALLQLSESRVRKFARAGLLQASRGDRGEYRFSFQDIVLLRAAKALDDAQVPSRKLWQALRSLREQLPDGRSLATVRIAAAGDDVVVRDATSTWEPYSGQAVLEFDVADLARDAAPMVRKAAQLVSEHANANAADWFRIAMDLEAIGAMDRAIDAYENVLRTDPDHSEACINLGRLQHDNGELATAERLYRQALAAEQDNVLGWFNLGVVLDDQGRAGAARLAYEQALKFDENFADAHFNLARLHERDGQAAQALRHFSRYRSLTRNA